MFLATQASNVVPTYRKCDTYTVVIVARRLGWIHAIALLAPPPAGRLRRILL